MKKINILFALAAALVAVDAVAQGYTRIQFNFAPQVMEIKDAPSEAGDVDTGWEGAKLSTMGFGLGFVKGIALSQSTPLFLEIGGNLTFLSKSDEETKKETDYSKTYEWTTEAKYKFLNLAVPVNFAYRVNVADAFSIQPFVGVNMKFNLVGKVKYTETEDGESESYDVGFFTKEKFEGEEQPYYFGKDDDNKAKRFQLGLNVGCGFNIAKRLYVGYTFQPDLVKYAECYGGDNKTYKVKTRSNVITLGFNF